MHVSAGRRALPPLVAVVFALAALPAATPPAAAQSDDVAVTVPGSVARIDALGGDVVIVRGDDNATLAAAPNAPILPGDYVTTGTDGRAEVGFDGRSAVRLGAGVQLRLVSVDPADRQIQLAAGTIELRLFGDPDGASEIDTPSVSVIPRTAGSFRVAVDDNGETAVTVRAGRADVETPQGDRSLEPGTTLLAGGPAANPSIRLQPAVALDDFDAYNADRDRVALAATAEDQYVNTDIAGVGDLNGYGDWVDDGSYGYVWMPANVAPGWAPYRDGNWVWEEGFGWTWVAAEPWGWAPYHYGRWYFSAAYQRWAWYPPRPGQRAPDWSPALVGFVGFDVGALSVGFGNIGWVPLAPYEAVHPWWGPHASAAVDPNAAMTGVRYRNLSIAGAMTSVTRENFQNGHLGNPLVPRTPFGEQQASAARATHVADHPQIPAYAQPQYYRQTTPAYAQPQYNRQTAPDYAQPQYTRAAAPVYSRPASPAYARPASPAYAPAASAYARPAMRAYGRAPQPHPQARPTHGNEQHG